jgi:molybdate transport system substrate-binding protein
VPGLTPVGETVAKGENQYGFQAVSELLAVEGVEVIGKLPDAVEFVTPVSAAIAVMSKNPEGARSLLRFLTRPEMAPILEQHGLDLAAV